MVFSKRTSLILGILIISLGTIGVLNTLGVTAIDTSRLFSIFWPLLLIFWGGDALLGDLVTGKSSVSRGKVERIIGLIILFLGIASLGRNLNLFDIDLSLLWQLLWPVLLIYVGWSIIRGTRRGSHLNMAIMSGVEIEEEGWKLEERDYLALMGGLEMDLSVASIPEGEIGISLTAIMGGITIKVPREMNVECHGTALLGGVDFFDDDAGGLMASRHFVHQGAGEDSPRLKISCRAIMGGIEIIGV